MTSPGPTEGRRKGRRPSTLIAVATDETRPVTERLNALRAACQRWQRPPPQRTEHVTTIYAGDGRVLKTITRTTEE
jgi:hypothetical protein